MSFCMNFHTIGENDPAVCIQQGLALSKNMTPHPQTAVYGSGCERGVNRNGVDRTPVEHFLAGIGGWTAAVRRMFEGHSE